MPPFSIVIHHVLDKLDVILALKYRSLRSGLLGCVATVHNLIMLNNTDASYVAMVTSLVILIISLFLVNKANI